MISEAEAQELDATLLPALERHHLRLLAHGLRTLQAVGAPTAGALPPRAAVEAWVAAQAPIAADPPFQAAFVEQLLGVGVQLERIAADRGCAPLALPLEALIAWARQQADQRLSDPATASPPPG